MSLTPEERRERIYEMTKRDPEFQKMYKDYAPGKEWFIKTTDKLPKELSNKLWQYPGMGYFIHHRMLTLICEHMKFEDE